MLAWTRMAGRQVDLRDQPWLRGPAGEAGPVGDDYFARLAERTGQTVQVNLQGTGLLADFHALRSAGLDPGRVDPRIRAFYERTSEYRLDLWSSWCRCFQPFGWLISSLFSRRLEQLNLPITSLEPCRGVTSDLIQLVEPASGQITATGWLRRFNETGRVIYAGVYSTARPPNAAGPCIKVVFPLPQGNASVFLRPVVQEDRSLLLLSQGCRFGDPGFYLIVHQDSDRVWARYVPAMTESLHVYVDNRGDLRTDHIFRLRGVWFLKLHYAIVRQPQPDRSRESFHLSAAS